MKNSYQITCDMASSTRSTGANAEGFASLLYLNSNNTAETLRDRFQFSGYEVKKTLALRDNTARFIKMVGIERVGFLTLTFKDNVLDAKEAYRRFCSLRKHFLALTFTDYMLVKERQVRGAWHYHLLVGCCADIRTGFDFGAVFPEKGRGDYSSASPYLRSLWRDIRDACEKYGFGRSELAPIKSNADGIAAYVGKYIEQNVKGKNSSGFDDKGVRLVSYSKKWPRTSTKFSWNTPGAKEWRRKLSKFANILGVDDLDGMKHHFGRRWAYFLADLISDVDSVPEDVLKEIAYRRL